MAQQKTGRKRLPVEYPESVPCGSCSDPVDIDSVNDKRAKWRGGQRKFFCCHKCYAKSRVGNSGPRSMTAHFIGNKYSLNKSPVNKIKVENPRFFETIDCEARAYFLGLIAADGCVQSDSIKGHKFSISLIDREPLEELKSCLGSEHTIRSRAIKSGSTMHFLTIGDKQLVNDLISHGITPRKTATLAMPETVPHKMKRHFIRGYMDGDGDIGLYQRTNRPTKQIVMSFYGTRALIEPCVEYLSEAVGLKSTYTYQLGTLTRFHRTHNQAHKVLDHLYNGANYYFERKRSIYDAWLKSRGMA